jgi:hypothetical protein
LIFLTLPALAMMQRSGHMHGEKDTEKVVNEENGSPGFPLPVGEKAVLPWHDDMIMRLIMEGRIDLPRIRGTVEVKQITMNSFYLDETPVNPIGPHHRSRWSSRHRTCL